MFKGPSTRLCPYCQRELSLTAESFEPCAKSKDGFRRKCRDCRRADWQQWKDANRDEINARKRERRAANPEPFREARKRRYYENPEKERAMNQRYQKANRQKLTEQERDRLRCNEAVKAGKERFPDGFTLCIVPRNGLYIAVSPEQRLSAYETAIARYAPHLTYERLWVVSSPPVVLPAYRGQADRLNDCEMRLWQKRSGRNDKEAPIGRSI